MWSLPLAHVVAQVLLFTSSHALWLNLNSSHSSGWSETCDDCAPVEKLRATAFGIDIAPDYVTLAMKHTNGTLSAMLKTIPGDKYGRLMVEWMRVSQQAICLSQTPKLKTLVERRHQTEFLTDILRHLLSEIEKRYPGTALEYGGISMPDFVYGDNVLKAIVEKAINSANLPDPRYASPFLLYPTDFTVVATTIDTSPDAQDNSRNFDALVITNTSSALSASWYQFSLIQYSIGHMIDPRVDIPYLTPPKTFTPSTPEFGPVPKTIHIPAKPDLARVAAFVKEREDLYAKHQGVGKRLMTGRSRLILRLDAESEADVHAFGKELNSILKGTRFDPAGKKTTVYREEQPKQLTWAPALHIASDMKSRVDAGAPFGCTSEHQICLDLKACVKQEALGDLVICEDATPPQSTIRERVDSVMKDGLWRFWRRSFLSSTAHLLDELEARLWLLYCASSMPWSGPSSLARCSSAIVDLGGGEQGVEEAHVRAVSGIMYAVSLYWIDGSTISALASIPMQWVGPENLLKVGVWAVSRVLGKDMYQTALGFVEDFWEMDLKPVMEVLPEGKRMEWNVRWD